MWPYTRNLGLPIVLLIWIMGKSFFSSSVCLVFKNSSSFRRRVCLECPCIAPSPGRTSPGKDFHILPWQTGRLSSAPRSSIDPSVKRHEELSKKKNPASAGYKKQSKRRGDGNSRSSILTPFLLNIMSNWREQGKAWSSVLRGQSHLLIYRVITDLFSLNYKAIQGLGKEGIGCEKRYLINILTWWKPNIMMAKEPRAERVI